MSEMGLGLDLCEIARMAENIRREGFLKRVFTQSEQAYADGRGAMRASSYAAMWAAKEAFSKALGTGIVFPMTDVEVLHEDGRPGYAIHGEAGKLLGDRKALLSLTHEAGMAGAVCMIL